CPLSEPRRQIAAEKKVNVSIGKGRTPVVLQNAHDEGNLKNSPSSDSPQPDPTDAAPAIDRKVAGAFLRLLDSTAEAFTFQTFDDSKLEGHEPDPRLARVTSNHEEVVALYMRGAGVYITVNQTDLVGRKSPNILRVRAVWQEDDDGHGGPFPLQPSLTVESSPGKFHRYWLGA